MDRICYWDDETQEQSERDATEEEQSTIDARRAAATSEAPIEKWVQIKAERDRRILSGGYLVAGHWYHSDLVSRSQQLGLARKADKVETDAGDMSATFTIGGGPVLWKTMDNGYVPMTATLAQAIVTAAEAQDAAVFLAAVVHKTAMEAAEDPSAYDFMSSGWPTIFEGA